VIPDQAEFAASLQPGHLWMPLFTGAHVSTDVAMENGQPRWWRHTTGKHAPAEGTFDYWTIHAGSDPALEAYLGDWLRKYLQGFTGIVNIETIGGRMLECHLRMAEQWLDLNGRMADGRRQALCRDLEIYRCPSEGWRRAVRRPRLALDHRPRRGCPAAARPGTSSSRSPSTRRWRRTPRHAARRLSSPSSTAGTLIPAKRCGKTCAASSLAGSAPAKATPCPSGGRPRAP
jgi:hypothetical protein